MANNDEKLYNTIVEKQGNLLYMTLSEECAELIQACSKIQRKKFFNKDFSEEVDNLLEEIHDVEMNLFVIKEQLVREPSLNLTREDIESRLQEWHNLKIKKLEKIFLEKGE